MPEFDTVICNGLVVDGIGEAPRRANVAISQGVMQAVGAGEARGREEIDATGLLVTPGFIDLHTHYDALAIWSERLNPSSSHGVSTVVLGNCGIGLAPCRPGDRDLLCATMEGVEDIPGVVMREGLTWEWESFAEFPDTLDTKHRDIDIGVFAPQSPIRVYVMGASGANREAATDDDLTGMSKLVREAVGAGVLGFATSRTVVDRRSDGAHIPSFGAGEDEILVAPKAVKAAGGGMIQMISELGMIGQTPEQEFALMRSVSDATGLAITYTIVPSRNRDREFWHELLRLTREHNQRGGATIHPQYFPRPVGMLASFDLTSNPFLNTPAYKADINVIDHERLTLHGPEIVDDLPGGGRRLDQRATRYRYMLVSGEIITRDDRPTGVLPRRLVRGVQARPPVSPAA